MFKLITDNFKLVDNSISLFVVASCINMRTYVYNPIYYRYMFLSV